MAPRNVALLSLAVATLFVSGCKGKSGDDGANKAGTAAQSTVKKPSTNAISACLTTLSKIAKQGPQLATAACIKVCPSIGDYAKIKKSQRTARARNIGLPHAALLSQVSYLAMRAGQCLQAWAKSASDADKKSIGARSAVVALPLAIGARGYYELARSAATTKPLIAGKLLIVTSGQLNIANVPQAHVSLHGSALKSAGFPGKKVPLHQLASAGRKRGEQVTMVAHHTLPLLRLARVVHSLGGAQLAVAGKSGAVIHPIQVFPSPAQTPQDAFRKWPALLKALDGQPKLAPIHIRIDDQDSATNVGALTKLLDRLAASGSVTKVFFANPVDPNAVAAATKAHVSLGPIQAVGAKPSVIKRIIGTRLGQLKTCYVTQLPAKPKLGGTLVAMVKGDSAGVVTMSRARGVDRHVGRCVAAALKTLRFGKQAGNGFRATIEVRFSAEQLKKAPR